MKTLARILLVAISLSSLSLAAQGSAPMANTAGFGGKIGLDIVDNEGAAFGWGGHFLYGIDLRGAGTLALYPNIEFWVNRHEYIDYNPNPNRYWYTTLFEANINFDARYYFPLRASIPVNPFVGLGIGPNIATWHPDADYNNYYNNNYGQYHGPTNTDVGILFSIFGGIDIPVSSNIRPFFEMRLKTGDFYTVFKMTAGLTFLL